MVTRGNYEEYIMMHVDGELQPAQEKALQDFLALHPELKNDLLSYELTKSSPDVSMIFTGKNSLLKPLPVKRLFIPRWTKYGIAAGIAAIVFLSMFKFLAPNRDSEVARSGQSMIKRREKATPGTISAQPTIEIVKNDTIAPAIGTHTTTRAMIAKSIIKKNRKSIVPDQVIVPIAATSINKIAVAEIKQLPCHKPETRYPSVAEIPAYPSTANNAEEKKTFWDKLPIDELKKKELKNISDDIKNDLDENKLTIKIEKRKLILSF